MARICLLLVWIILQTPASHAQSSLRPHMGISVEENRQLYSSRPILRFPDWIYHPIFYCRNATQMFVLSQEWQYADHPNLLRVLDHFYLEFQSTDRDPCWVIRSPDFREVNPLEIISRGRVTLHFSYVMYGDNLYYAFSDRPFLPMENSADPAAHVQLQ